jgi:hypothetical protein
MARAGIAPDRDFREVTQGDLAETAGCGAKRTKRKGSLIKIYVNQS